MERLTKRDGGLAHFPACFEEPCVGGGCEKPDCDFWNRVCDRLCDLEDKLENGTLAEVIRCKDCRYCEYHGRIPFCERKPQLLLVTKADGFCSEGRRKDHA